MAALGGPKIVKTYEFHLPMHNIREEGSLNSAEISQKGRYDNIGKASTMFRQSKRKDTGLEKKDEISS